MKKISDQEIDDLLLINNKTLLRAGKPFKKNKRIYCLWQCVICNHKWDTALNSAIKGINKCPKCARKIKYSDVEVDKILKTKNLIKISSYKNSSSSLKLKCLICNFIFSNSLNHIKKNQGCSSCSGKCSYSNKKIDLLLKDKSFIRLSNYVNNKTNVKWLCKKCKYEFEETIKIFASKFIFKNKNCKNCNLLDKIKNNNKLIDDLLKNNHPLVIRLSDAINNRTKFKLKCNNCYNIWKTTPAITKGRLRVPNLFF